MRLVGWVLGRDADGSAGSRWLALGDEGGGMSNTGSRCYWVGSVSVWCSTWLEGLLWDGDNGCGADDHDGVAWDGTFGIA